MSETQISALHQSVREMFDFCAGYVSQCEVIAADNVFAYTNQTYQEGALIHNEIPNAVPPFPLCLTEWFDTHNGTQYAVLSDSVDMKNGGKIERDKIYKEVLSCGNFDGSQIPDEIARARWIVGNVIFTYAGDRMGMVPSRFFVFINEDGSMEDAVASMWLYSTGIQAEDLTPRFVYVARTALMTFALMNCTNVKAEDATAQIGPTEKWIRRSRVPKITYKILSIEPFKEVARRQSGSPAQQVQRSFHICRGGFADYTKGNGLFGKWKVVVWKAAHVRGDRKNGEVIKDYKIGGLP